MIKNGKNIIGNQYPQERIANMCIELYVSACVLSRTTMLLNDSNENETNKNYYLKIAKLALHKSRGNFTANLKKMEENQDEIIKEVSNETVKNKLYNIDIL
mgnify:CR=1 FL=1